MNTQPELQGITAVVTGAGRGIGAACVRHLLRAGASVLALVQPQADNELTELAAADVQNLQLMPVDVRSSAQVDAAARTARESFGRLDVLVNNAGVIHPIGRLGEVDPDQWGEVLAVNATAAMRCTHAFLPLLLAQRGLIVNMSSGAAYRPLEGWSAYCASKAALAMLSRATDLEYRAQGLRVFALGIPPTDTRMQGAIRDSALNEVSRIPQRNLNSPDVTASVLAWLCGPQARQRIDKVEIDVRDPEFAELTGLAIPMNAHMNTSTPNSGRARTRRVVVTDATFPHLDAERAAAEQHGARFEAFQCRSAQDVREAVRGADVALVQFAPLDAAAIEGLAPGAGIVRYGIGYDNIDLQAATARGHAVGYVPDYCTAEVADHAASMLLAALRKLPQLDASVRAGDWRAVAVAKPIRPFAETTIGFLGLGRIGTLVLQRLKGFGFRFLVSDPQVDAAHAADLGAQAVDRDALLRQSDALSLHAPATADTTHVINARSLATMQPHAVIVNTARGRLIDEAALADALVAGRIGGAALDVFENEPLPADSALRRAPRLLLTPHAAWYSDAAIVRLQALAALDIGRILDGQGPRCPVPGSPTVTAR